MSPPKRQPRNARRYETLHTELGMTQHGAARFLGLGQRTSRRWASGEIEVPDAILMLFEIMKAKRITPNKAREIAGLEPVTMLNMPLGRPPVEAD